LCGEAARCQKQGGDGKQSDSVFHGGGTSLGRYGSLLWAD
jgi:hypothetical protein